jgi:cyclophilin family peptidyl-prolyl cis-trans isomerase
MRRVDNQLEVCCQRVYNDVATVSLAPRHAAEFLRLWNHAGCPGVMIAGTAEGFCIECRTCYNVRSSDEMSLRREALPTWHCRQFAVICVLLFTAACTWTAPGPTFTPWPTLTPSPAYAEGVGTDAQADSTPIAIDESNEESSLTTTQFPDVPANPAQRNDMFDAPPPMIIDPEKAYTATIETAKGDIVCELYAKEAPQTVNNFVYLARAGFYDGLTFHRVVPGFVIQGGDPLGRGNGGPGYTIPAEIGLPHEKGALATARLSDQVNPERASSGSQFYITLDKTPHLDGGYTVFGQVVSGMPVVESIAIGDVIQRIRIAEE